MTDEQKETALTKRARPPRIEINGKVIQARRDLAAELGIADKTIARMNLPTVRIGGMAYVDRDAGLNDIAAKLRRRHEPSRRRRGGR